MSTIEKMSIQGIRSFGPDDGDKQIINFFQPLTLILGPNGTGKTTIIECLKYITTGVLPPGSKGGAFIHDPKIAHEREVKGQVRLQFSDVSGKQCIVQRSMVATQKAKKIETRTLDGVITRRNAAGEKQSINSKCADLDKEMITYLGVAKPVLENVIFCHQEDSNWPLSEGKTLKEKFDAIFASTRYVKALENIRKLKQDQDGTLKLHKQDLQYLKLHKDKAAQLEENLKELEGRLAASMQSVENIKIKLDPIEEKLDQIAKRSNEIYKVQTEITKLQSEKKQIDKNAREIQESIENEFQGSDEALRRELAEFQDTVREGNETLKEYEGHQAELSQQLSKYNKEKSALLVEVGRLEREAEGHAENIEKRDSFIRQYAEEYQFEGFERSDITDEKYKSFLENIRSKLDALINDTKSLKADYERKEDDLQKKMDELRDTKTKLEQNEKIKRDMVNENQMKIRHINQKLSEVEASAGKLDQLKRELKREEHELQTVESSVSVDVLKEEISELTKEKGKLDSKISELSSEMNVLHLQSSAQAQLDVLKKDRSSKEENIRRLKAKHEDTISYLLGHMPSRNIRGELDAYVSKQSEDVRKSNASLNENRNLLSKREAEKKMLADQLKRKEDDFKALEERILHVCGSQNYNDGLQIIQQKMTQSQDQRGSLLGAEHFFKKYATDLGKDDPCCPLCHREFDTEQEVRELILELQEKLRMVPAKLQKAEKDLEEFQKKYDDMMQLKPLKENMMTLETQEIPQLKTIVKKTNEEIDQLKTKIQDLEEVLEVKENDEATAKSIQNDIIMMDRYQGEVQELDKKIAAQSSRLAGGDSGRTLQEVITEKEDLQIKVDSIGRQLDHKRQKLSDHMDHVQKLRTSINSMREEKLGIENDLQQRIKLEEDKANLLSENEAHNQEIKESSSRIRPLQEKSETLKHEKEILTKEKEEKIEKAKAEVDQVKNNATKVKNVNQDIKSYNQSGKADTLEHSRSRTNQIQKKLDKIDMDQKEVTSNIDKLRKDLSSQKVRELDLQNNLSLRNKKREIEKMNAQILDLNAQLGGLDVSNLERERRKLQKQLDDLTKERHVAEGRQRGFEEQIKAAKKELQSDMYTGAAEKYRNKMIEFRTTEMANGDLQKYYRALDTAIMNYHNLKMAEINKIIRDLWRNTYRGNDIETIEIRSDEDDSVSMKTRRTYNYRVVMIKGDTALDMRGRCSAGQKVLASLIIRLALAETFCLNCGILALDEPTTNLDRENIESLAHALVDIIKGRSHQRNFQLMIITHDEDFVELLGRSDYVEEFYKVGKNQDGCSQLIRSKVSDLHR